MILGKFHAESRESSSLINNNKAAQHIYQQNPTMACNIHFPEYLGLYTRFDAVSGLAVLEKAPLPKDVIALGVEGIQKIWHEKKMRGRGVAEDRAKTLVQAAHNSVGLDGGVGTRSELYMLL